MEVRAAALQEQARRIQSGEIADSKFGPMKLGARGCRRLGELSSSLKLCRRRFSLCRARIDQVWLRVGLLQEARLRPTSEQALPVYVESIIVRDIQLVALPAVPTSKQPDIFSYEPRTAA